MDSLRQDSTDLKDKWDKVLKILSSELSEQSYKTWFEPVRCLRQTDMAVVLGVPDNYFGKWLKDHYQNLIESSIKEVWGLMLTVEFEIYDLEIKEDNAAFNNTKSIKENNLKPVSETGLNLKYTFDDFVIGPGNRFAHAASMAVSEAPAKHYNPLFIHGPVGVGKTHLMQSIAHEMKRRNPNFKVLYISSEKFTNQLINAIQTRSTEQFRSRYRNLDLLLIDDIQFIAQKIATQEEFFHTFNALYDAHKQIVVSSDRSPREISGLEERLISRFGWGLVTDIQPPEFETRVAILKKKMEKETVRVPDDVCYYIASQFKSNVRELEGALIRVVAYGSLTNNQVDLELAKKILQDSVIEEEQKLSIDSIQRIVADYFNIKIADLKSKRRTKSVAEPRQIAMFLVRSMTNHSFPEIGEFFGGRDHTTALHAYNKISKLVEEDSKKLRVVEELKDMLKKGR